MKIGLIAPIWISVPPKNFGFGAQEYLVYYIAQNLIKKGHQVTLFASGDSITDAKLVSVINKQAIDLVAPPSLHVSIKDTFELLSLSKAYQMSSEFDIIHNHLLPFGLLFEPLSKTPTVHTLHHVVYADSPKMQFYANNKNQKFISISNAQRHIIPDLNYFATVYNGVDTNYYSYKEKPGSDYLLYLGRIRKYKGIHVAVQLAKNLGKTLKIAAPLPLPNQSDYAEVTEYWKTDIQPFLGDKIEHINGIEGNEKIELIQNAKALIFPVEREEPFGMTVIEAMATGTPVIAYARGALPEIIEDGNTGFLVNPSGIDIRGNWKVEKFGYDGINEAVEKLYNMDQDQYIQLRQKSRKRAETNFTTEKMVDEYIKVYDKIINDI